MPENATTHAPAELAVHRDLRTVRDVIRRVKRSERLADLCLFGRRNPVQMLEYLDRRNCYRSRVEIPIHIVPAAFDGASAASTGSGEQEMWAVTRDVSRKGIGFAHAPPLEGEYAVISVDLQDGHPLSLLVEIRWSNVPRQGRYMSGGRFVGIAAETKA